MISASLPANFAADASRMSLSVSTLVPPLAHERPKRLPHVRAVRRVVREQDGLRVKLGKPRDRATCERHVVAEELVGKRHSSANALEHVADEDESVRRRVEAHAARSVSWGVYDPQAAEHRELVAVFER